jgi:hypothetical protein
MTDRLQDPDRLPLFTKPVTVIHREEYSALLAERDSLSTAHIRQRVVTILGAFTLAVAASLVGFVGGFWVGHHTNDQSFKAACSRVVDEALQNAQERAAKLPRDEETAAGSVQTVRH